MKTGHLEEFLLDFTWGGLAPNVRWVDEEHALAVFPCADAAQVLLASGQERFRVRPHSAASSGALLVPPEGAGGAGARRQAAAGGSLLL